MLYRYFSSDSLPQYQVGDVIIEKAFCSTSLIKKTMFLAHGLGQEYCYTITVGENTSGRNLYTLFQPDEYHNKEKEVLFPPGTRFKINRIEKNKEIITFHVTEELDDPKVDCSLATLITTQSSAIPTTTAAPPSSPPMRNFTTLPTDARILEVPGIRGQGIVQVQIPILKEMAPELSLESEKSLGPIFEIINAYTYSQPYWIGSKEYHEIFCSSKTVTLYRPNHDGTHGARQVRYFEACLDLATSAASPEKQKLLQQLTPEDLLQLKLVVYCLRSGRLDEYSHHSVDDYDTRSSLIYRAYAEQLGIDPKTIDRFSKYLVEACRPIHACSKDTQEDVLSLICHEMISAAHLMDLIRCFSSRHFEEGGQRFNELADCVAHFLGQDRLLSKKWSQQLLDYAHRVCLASGVEPGSVSRYPSGEAEKRINLYQSGKKCWEEVQKQPFPKWEASPFTG